MKEIIVKLLLVVIVLFSIPLKVHGQLPEWEGYQRTYTPGYETETYVKNRILHLKYAYAIMCLGKRCLSI